MAWWDGKDCADDVCIPAGLQNSVAELYEQAYECVHGTATTWPRYNSGQCVPASDINALRNAVAALIAQALALGRLCECAWDELNDSGYDPTDDCADSANISTGDAACICDYRCIQRGLQCFLNWESGACCNCCSACATDLEYDLNTTTYRFNDMQAVWTPDGGTYDTLEEACTDCGTDPVYSFAWNGTTYFCCDLSTVTWALLWEKTTPFPGNDRTCRLQTTGIASEAVVSLNLECEEEAFPSTVHACAAYDVEAPGAGLTLTEQPCECCPDFYLDESMLLYQAQNGYLNALTTACAECAPNTVDEVTSCLPYSPGLPPGTAWFICTGEQPLVSLSYWDMFSGCSLQAYDIDPAATTVEADLFAPGASTPCGTVTVPGPDMSGCNPWTMPDGACGIYVWTSCTTGGDADLECGDAMDWSTPYTPDAPAVLPGYTYCNDLVNGMVPGTWYAVDEQLEGNWGSHTVCAWMCQETPTPTVTPPSLAGVLGTLGFIDNNYTLIAHPGFGLFVSSTYDCYEQTRVIDYATLVLGPSATAWSIINPDPSWIEELECEYTRTFASAVGALVCDYDLDDCDCASGTAWEIEIEIDYNATDGCPEINIVWKYSNATPTNLGETGAPCTMSGYPDKDNWYIHTFDQNTITCRTCREYPTAPGPPSINDVLMTMSQQSGGTIFPHPEFGLRLYAYALCPDWGDKLFDGADIYIDLDDTGWVLDSDPSPLPDTCRFILDSSTPMPSGIPCDWNVNECGCMPSSSSSSSSSNGGP